MFGAPRAHSRNSFMDFSVFPGIRYGHKKLYGLKFDEHLSRHTHNNKITEFVYREHLNYGVCQAVNMCVLSTDMCRVH